MILEDFPENIEVFGSAMTMRKFSDIARSDRSYGTDTVRITGGSFGIDFSKFKSKSGGGAAATQLSVGISEALYNTSLGLGTSPLAIIFYNVFTTRIDGITYGIDESGFTLTQSFGSLYK
jgi:hypothetical protein